MIEVGGICFWYSMVDKLNLTVSITLNIGRYQHYIRHTTNRQYSQITRRLKDNIHRQCLQDWHKSFKCRYICQKSSESLLQWGKTVFKFGGQGPLAPPRGHQPEEVEWCNGWKVGVNYLLVFCMCDCSGCCTRLLLMRQINPNNGCVKLKEEALFYFEFFELS